MFEKEAEERAKRKISNFIPQQWGVSLIRTERTYETVEGAPHFYLRSLTTMWKEGSEYGYNKANEWHYVKDGDLPPERLEGKQILVVPQKHKFTEPMFVVGYYLLSEYRVGIEKKFYFDSDCRDEIDKPYAWKEIVLPEK